MTFIFNRNVFYAGRSRIALSCEILLRGIKWRGANFLTGLELRGMSHTHTSMGHSTQRVRSSGGKTTGSAGTFSSSSFVSELLTRAVTGGSRVQDRTSRNSNTRDREWASRKANHRAGQNGIGKQLERMSKHSSRFRASYTSAGQTAEGNHKQYTVHACALTAVSRTEYF